MKTYEFVVKELPDEPRLDKVIPLHVKELSRSQTRKLIEEGGVYLNRKRCQKNAKTVTIGDKIRVVAASQEAIAARQEFILEPRHVLFENADIIVVNKPPQLPTHGTIDSSRFHLVEAIEQFLERRDGTKKAYLGVHHRLDLDTSGVILFTKRKEANVALAQAFQGREVQKTYLALSQGAAREPLLIKSFLGPSKRNKRFFCSVRSGGKYAETAVRILSSKKIQGKDVCLVEASPKTGRTHQIRVHLSENRLPILGDESYGVNFPGVERVMLHAWKLELLGLSFKAPLPDDFRRLDFHEPQE
jgi:23S rRNA pseudouridine955/2504/2580 synthase